jgi:uncharacterized protein YcaQ
MDRERPGYVAAVEQAVVERGPLTFGELPDPGRRPKQPTGYAESSTLWWNWADGKSVLEMLFDGGRLAVAGRRNFERLYDLTERVIPQEVLAAPTPAPEEAQRALVRHAARALGVATVRDLRDYFRLGMAVTKGRIRELVDGGDLVTATVEGWDEVGYAVPGIRPVDVDARALLAPFDPVVWERSRVRRVFGYRHSFELYVPAARREFGYFVLPVLLGDRLVARADLKADRAAGTLVVAGAFAEPGVKVRATAAGLAESLREMAAWLGLDRIEVADRGDLASALRSETAGTRRGQPHRQRRAR